VAGLTDEGGIVLDQSIFYPTGGGQPGDSGHIIWPGGPIALAKAVKGKCGRLMLMKTLSVQPHRSTGQVRLIRIGDGAGIIDLQHCSGTHVARRGEIGPVTVGRINRRVTLVLR
jgi:Ser-tRNA(Ala) deacylase AlaX